MLWNEVHETPNLIAMSLKKPYEHYDSVCLGAIAP